MSITLHCSCGKTLAVAEQYRGKKAKCPSCGNVLAVEEPVHEVEVDLAAAVQSDLPAKRVTALDDDEGLPEVRKPLRRPSDVKQSWVPWVVAGGMVLVGLVFVMLCAGAAMVLLG